jgi:hypothetical protein
MLEHLKMLQGIINRLAGNSFSIKGWSVTLVAAILAWAAGKDAGSATIVFALAAMIPVLFFWGLDAYYLNLERQFRKLYEVILLEEKKPENERTIQRFSMSLQPIANQVETVKCTAWRNAVWGFHLPLFVAVVLACGALWCFHSAKPLTGQQTGGQTTLSAPTSKP